MRRVKPELVDSDKNDIVVLHPNPGYNNLIKANRLLFKLVFALTVAVFLLGLFIVPETDIVRTYSQNQKEESLLTSVQDPVISSEINQLKSQMVGLVSGSIESKLRILESNIKKGSFRESLGNLQDLKNDVKILRSYSQPTQTQDKTHISAELLAEVSQLKDLIYLTLASCGLMFAAMGGIWIRNLYRLVHHSDYKSKLGKD